MRLTRDLVAGLIGLALSIWLLVLTRGMPRSTFVPIGPDFYPRIVLVLTAILSLAVIAGDLARRRRAASAGGTPANYRLVVLTFAAFGLYVGLLPHLGFRLATLLFVAGLQILLEPPRSPGLWLTVAIVAFVSSFATFLVFERHLSILLPRGGWTGF